MFCKYCGNEIANGSVFCKYCGSNLSSGRKATTEGYVHEAAGECDNNQTVEQVTSKKKPTNKWAIIIPVIVVILGSCVALLFLNADKFGPSNEVLRDVAKEEQENKEVSAPKKTTTPKPEKPSQKQKKEEKKR